ncbi:MAG: hypothetical protein WBG90_07470 [Saonia sp.]
MDNRTENEYAEFWIENGILFFVYKDGISVDLPMVIKIVEDRLKLQQGRTLLNFSDIRGVKSVDKAARNYLAREGSVLIKAVALLVDNPLNKVISQFYVKANNPPIPTKVFTEREAALMFLETFR